MKDVMPRVGTPWDCFRGPFFLYLRGAPHMIWHPILWDLGMGLCDKKKIRKEKDKKRGGKLKRKSRKKWKAIVACLRFRLFKY